MIEKRKALLGLLKLTDLSVVAACLVVAVAANAGGLDVVHWRDVLGMRIKLSNLLFLAAYLGWWHVVLQSLGLYSSYRLAAASRELRDLGTAVVIGMVPLVAFGYLRRFEHTGPAVLLLFASLSLVALSAERRLLRAIGRRVRQYGRNLRNVIIVGTGTEALALGARLARREDLGYHVLDVIECGNDGNGSRQGDEAEAVLARVDRLVEQRPVDEVFLALPLDSARLLMQRLVAVCEEQGVTVRVMAHVASLQWASATADAIEGQPVFTVRTGPGDAAGLATKRLIDIVGAAIGLAIFSPLFLVVAVVIKLTSPGPVLFAQERVGLNRRRFQALKFRTMVVGAERMQAALEPFNEATGPVFKIENDPRVTPVGKWLRRLSIDELPQLLNVLRGDMSLVGPRPLPERDVSRIDVRWHKRRFSVKPGITCLWQVNNREPKFDEWIRQDMEYIDNWSLGLDLRILARTVPAVLSRHGAH